jgi:outer membrane receptor for ferrienterochelin and colicins
MINSRWFTTLCLIAFLGVGSQVFSQGTTDLAEMSLEDLLNMEVTTVSKSAEKQSDAPGIISMLTKDELQRFGGTTLKDILERVPGLISSSVSFIDATTMAARGDQIKNTSGHILLLINGRPTRETHDGGLNSEMYNTFPVNIIERIEVIKGPGSVLYGSDAFSAVINIITEKAERNSLSVTGTGVADGGYGSSGSATVKLGELGIVVAGRHLKKDWEIGSTEIPDKGPGAYLGVNYKSLSIMSTYNSWTSSATSAGMGGESQWERVFTNLGYNLKVNDKWNMDFNTTYTQTDDDLAAPRKKSYNVVGEWTNFITISDKSKLVIGGLFNKIHGRETMSGSIVSGGVPTSGADSNPSGNVQVQGATSQAASSENVIAEGRKNNYAFYAQVDYRLRENLKLIGGTQVNKPENIKINIVPRAGVIWYPVPRINVKALYSSAFRAPSISELYLNPGIKMGNTKLTPEKVATIDFGISYQGEQTQFGVNIFHSKMTDIISTVNMRYSNNAEITFKGIESGGAYYVNRSLYLNASLLYQTNESDTSKNVSYVANLGAKGGISYVWDKGITVSLFDIYQGKMDDKYAGTGSGSKLAYNLLHLHSQYNINKLFGLKFKPEFSLYLNVDDLLNKKYYFSGQMNSTPAQANPGRVIYFGLGACL